MKKILFNTLSLLFAAAVIYFLGKELWHNFEQIRTFQFSFNVGLLALASGIYAVSFFLLGVGWFFLLKYVHHPLPFLESILYFLITQPAKYIPGKIWIAVARSKLCKHHDIPHSITFLTTGIEGVFEIIAGMYVALLAILQTPALGKFSLIGSIAITGVGLLLLIPRIFYFLINLYLRLVKQEQIPQTRHVTFLQLLGVQAIYIVALAGLGSAQMFFLQSFAPVNAEHFPLLISVGALTYSASILAFFVPSGLGVREGIWVVALKQIIVEHIAIIYAFASRLWTMIIEAILVAICLPILWVSRNRNL